MESVKYFADQARHLQLLKYLLLAELVIYDLVKREFFVLTRILGLYLNVV